LLETLGGAHVAIATSVCALRKSAIQERLFQFVGELAMPKGRLRLQCISSDQTLRGKLRTSHGKVVIENLRVTVNQGNVTVAVLVRRGAFLASRSDYLKNVAVGMRSITSTGVPILIVAQNLSCVGRDCHYLHNFVGTVGTNRRSTRNVADQVSLLQPRYA
jgi:hypothetical protein